MSGVDQFAAAYAERVQLKIAKHPMDADVLDVVDRALAMDPEAVPEGLRASIPEPSDEADEEPLGSALGPFARAYADRAQRVADERRMSPVPLQSSAQRRRWWPIALAGGLLAAAAAILVVQLGDLSSASQDSGTGGVEAQSVRSEHADTGAFEARTPRPKARSTTPERAVEAEAEPELREPEPEPAPLPPEPEPEPERRTPPKMSLEGLEARAHARWKAGELAGAEADLRAIIHRSGRNRRSELAYGDLFAVAFQRGGERAQTRAWKQYLRKFPKGRFADDVEAGLCRRAPVERRSTCWKKYLQHQAKGAHRSEAMRTASP